MDSLRRAGPCGGNVAPLFSAPLSLRPPIAQEQSATQASEKNHNRLRSISGSEYRMASIRELYQQLSPATHQGMRGQSRNHLSEQSVELVPSPEGERMRGCWRAESSQFNLMHVGKC
jgi:hypothetical protein